MGIFNTFKCGIFSKSKFKCLQNGQISSFNRLKFPWNWFGKVYSFKFCHFDTFSDFKFSERQIAKIIKIKFQSLQNCHFGRFWVCKTTKLVSRKIWEEENFLKFPHCVKHTTWQPLKKTVWFLAPDFDIIFGSSFLDLPNTSHSWHSNRWKKGKKIDPTTFRFRNVTFLKVVHLLLWDIINASYAFFRL